MKQKSLTAVTRVLGILTLALSIAGANASTAEPRTEEGVLIVKLASSGAGVSDGYAGLLARIQAKDMGPIRHAERFRVVRLTGRVAAAQALKALNAAPEIEYAEPNYIYTIESAGAAEPAFPSDKHFSKQWALWNTGQKVGKDRIKGTPGADIRMPLAWAEIPGSADAAADVTVAVIDTGINLKHPDLSGNVWRNSGENGPWTPGSDAAGAAKDCRDLSCNKIDDDGNGYVDDFAGWNWAVKTPEGQPVVGNNDAMDDNMHGSHVSGIIGARHDAKGIAGVNNRVKLMALKFLSSKGEGSLEGALGAIHYAIRMGADVINASWGGPGKSRALGEAVKAASDAGLLFVAAAGNSAENNDYLDRLPANYPYAGVVSVVATDMNDNVAYFSSFGKARTHVAAPGFEILSTVKGKGHESLSGTSMAAPHVAGLAAMMIGLEPSLRRNPAAVKARLMETTDLTVGLMSKTASGGRINALNVLTGTVPAGHRQPSGGRWSEFVSRSVESAHPYSNGAAAEFTVRHEGARWIRVRFGRHGLETGRDNVELYDKDGNLFDVLTGYGLEAVSRAVEGDEIRMVLRSDKTVSGWGFEILGYEYME